jgi:tetratricopeptide (TPR) repeat protein
MIRNAGYHLLSRLMLLTKSHILRLVLFCAVLFFFFCISPAKAHVEKGSMPDSVAEMEYRILLEFKPDNLEVRNKLGMVLYRSGKFNKAAREFDYILKKDPENIDALTALARVNTKLSNYQQAIALFNKAIAINPDDMHIYYYFGQTMEMQGNLSGAEEVYKNGLYRESPSQSEQSAEDRQALIEALKNLQERKEKTKLED